MNWYFFRYLIDRQNQILDLIILYFILAFLNLRIFLIDLGICFIELFYRLKNFFIRLIISRYESKLDQSYLDLEKVLWKSIESGLYQGKDLERILEIFLNLSNPNYKLSNQDLKDLKRIIGIA